jgi:hypothetical protein
VDGSPGGWSLAACMPLRSTRGVAVRCQTTCVLLKQARLTEVVGVNVAPHGRPATAVVKQRGAWIAPDSSVVTQLVRPLFWEPLCG